MINKRMIAAGLLAGSLLSINGQTPMAEPNRTRPSTSGIQMTADETVTKASAFAQAHRTDTAYTKLGDAFMQKARETADLSYYVRAEGAYQGALKLNPQYGDALIGMAWVQSGRHEFESSIEWAKKALAGQPNRSDAYALLGDAAVEMGNYEDAFELYQKMLDLRPDLSSYSRAGHLLFLTGDIKKAIFMMTKALAAGGPYAENAAWCRTQIALMHFAEGSYVTAKQTLTEGLRQTPNNYHLLQAMGKVNAALKDYPSAIAAYEKAQAVVPQFDVAVALGDLYALQGKAIESKAQFALVEAMRKLNKANGVTGDLQAAQFYADHDLHLTEALQMAEIEYKTRPNVYVADTLAWCYFKNGQIPEARKYIAKALKERTPEAMFLYHKALIEAKAGGMAAARTALYQALSLSPQWSPVAAPEAVRMARELGSEARQ